ncbi:MAG TPA: hypothetical protein VG734_18550 [Lacunisphaera sp.]|nr:hypothetical protein [Lacunisphaera sp.]
MIPRRPLVPSLALAALLLPVPGNCAAASAPAGEAGKDFTLFMGSDIEVGRNRELQLVRDFKKGDFMVRDNGALVRVPVSAKNGIDFKISRKLKLAESAVKIDGLGIKRAYTLAHDPGRQLIAAQAAAQASVPDANTAAMQLARAMDERGSATSAPSSTGPGAGPGLDQGELTRTQTNLMNATRAADAANSAAGSGVNSAGSEASRLADEVGADAFDALEIVFRISSPQPIADAYLVVIAQYRAPDFKPGLTKNWVYAEELGTIDDQPRRVFIRQGGFPPGFQLVNQDVHFYQHGRELASNVAAKAVPLSREEAHEYMVVEYLTESKDATNGPSIALGIDRQEAMPHYTEALLQRQIFIKVDKAGRPQGVYGDKYCIQSTGDKFLDGLVSRVRFMPAVKEGKAIESVAQVRIADLITP